MLGPSVTVTAPSPATSRSATPALSKQRESKTGELKVPNFLMEHEPSSSLASSWIEVEDDSEGEGVLVSPPNEEDEFIASSKESKNKKNTKGDIEKLGHPMI